ncbi:hypothetical protein B0H17DRAFT_922965, partial [Mycena rosella]
VHFNADIKQDIRDHLSGANGKFAVEFVSFPDSDDPGHFFVRGKRDGDWTACLPDYFIQRLGKMQRETPNFDVGLTGILFGQGKTNICLFKGGFDADFDKEHVDSDAHPLFKALIEFSGAGWCIERGSTLCFYDSRFFFLKFKKPGETTIQMRWNLPTDVAAKLEDLKKTAQEPAEQLGMRSLVHSYLHRY